MDTAERGRVAEDMNSREQRKEELANRLPPNQPLEWTPPRCALRRHSAARYTSAGFS